MPSALVPSAPLRVLVIRAILSYIPLRLIAMGAARLLQGGLSISPPAMIIVCSLLGAVDLRRRGESMLWANLGYPAWVTTGIFAVVAFVGEALLVLART